MLLNIIVNVCLILIGFQLGRNYTDKGWHDLINSDSMLKDTFKLYQEGQLDQKKDNPERVSTIEETKKSDPGEFRSDQDFSNYKDF